MFGALASEPIARCIQNRALLSGLRLVFVALLGCQGMW
jgi:hypothetical protein